MDEPGARVSKAFKALKLQSSRDAMDRQSLAGAGNVCPFNPGQGEQGVQGDHRDCARYVKPCHSVPPIATVRTPSRLRAGRAGPSNWMETANAVGQALR